MELVRQKNVATYIVFPIVDADGDFVTGAAGLDSEIDAWADGSAPDGFADCTNEATEIASTGVYYLSLTQAEMNNDYIVVQVKTSTSGAKTQMILIRTMVGDPLLMATTDDGGAINVASGVVEANVKQIGDGAQSATDLKDFADTGYDPSTHKVQGVVLTDTCTTNTDMRGTNSAALASVCTEARLAELDAAGLPADVAAVAAYVDTEIADLITAVAGIPDAVLDEVLADLADTDIDAGADITPRKAIRALFNRFFRKVIQTATAQTVYNDAGSAIADMATNKTETTTTRNST